MSTAIVVNEAKPGLSQELERVLIGGDLSKLSPDDRVSYYKAVCESVGLNPLTRPFEYITLNGKLVLYARKDCTDQLRNIHAISLTIPSREMIDGVYVVTAKACRPDGRIDESTGAVAIEGLKGEAKANAMMKSETKSKRRVTLSICGLGLLDETEIETISDARPFQENAREAQQRVLDRKLAEAQTEGYAPNQPRELSKAEAEAALAELGNKYYAIGQSEVYRHLTLTRPGTVRQANALVRQLEARLAQLEEVPA